RAGRGRSEKAGAAAGRARDEPPWERDAPARRGRGEPAWECEAAGRPARGEPAWEGEAAGRPARGEPAWECGAAGRRARGEALMIPESWYLTLSAALFTIGVVGVVIRRNPLVIFMSIELALNAANLALVTFGQRTGNPDGQALVFFVMAVAAAEV